MELKSPTIIETNQVRIFIGKNCITNFTKNDTPLLWQSFMPLVKNIPRKKSDHLFAIDSYLPGYSFDDFDPQINYTKWACVEIESTNDTHQDLAVLEIPPSLYAVFEYIGTATEANQAFEIIFNDWMKQGQYLFDSTRPLVCEMNTDYKPTNPEEKELIWIPIKLK